MEFEKLYDLTFPLTEDSTALYIQGNYRNRDEGGIYIDKGECADLGTYFNLFSLKKWTAYTSIELLKIKLNLQGSFYVEMYGMSNKNLNETFLRTTCENSFETILNIKDINFKYEFDLIGIKLVALSDGAIFQGGDYQGTFNSSQNVRIGITICTFKREKYLLPNLNSLQKLIKRNANYSVMVIDNGRTLTENESPIFQIIHNPNFGGAGGFTRGLIEQVSQGRNTHTILMDDDIMIELSVFDRLYSMLRHLKPEYQEKFFAGSMLVLDKPAIQFENTAYWDMTYPCACGYKYDLSEKEFLCQNEQIPDVKNHYAGWWFCCIPLEVVKKIGYPLPNFIKGDDVEYGIRNNKNILSINGIGVWHESFEKKLTNLVMQYFDDRNMILVTHFANGCGRLDFLKMCIKRIITRIRLHDGDGIRVLELALKDLNSGLYKIVSVKSDEKFDELRKYPFKKTAGKNVYRAIISSSLSALFHFLRFGHYTKECRRFREEKLKTQSFWRQFLGLNDEL